MSRSDWHIILATLGWLTLGASPPQQTAEKREHPAERNIPKSAQTPSARPIFQSIDPPKYHPPCRQPEDHDPCDLEAQWKAADAARDAADWGWWQMVFSAFGLAGLIYSLVLTRRATKLAIASMADADEARDIANRNAEAAAALANIAERNAKVEYAPQIWLDNVHIEFEGDVICQPVVKATISNSGTSSAIEVQRRIAITISDRRLNDIAKIRDCGQMWGDPITVGVQRGCAIAYTPMGFNPDILREVLAEKKAVYFYLGLSYRDLLDQSHSVEFIYFSTGEHFKSGKMGRWEKDVWETQSREMGT